MKKLLLGRVLTVMIAFAVSAAFMNLQGQVKVTFPNETGIDLGNPDGIAGRDAITLAFSIDGTGIISLDASTASTVANNVALVDSWDNTQAGTTDNSALFGKSFSLLIKGSGRIQSKMPGGLGIEGQNQWHLDQSGVESIYFILDGDVGIEFDSIYYRNATGLDDQPHFRIRDFDTDSICRLIKSPTDSVFSVPDGAFTMRYSTDSLTFSTSDTILNKNAGGRVYGLAFTVLSPPAKPPVVVMTTPSDGDTTVVTGADYVITFDNEMDQAATASAISFSPDVANRVNTWNEAGDVLTISFDDLPYFTDYVVTVGTGILSTEGKNAEFETSYTFRTRPAPPTVISVYPQDQSMKIPVNTPLAIEFSQSMLSDSVEKAVTFDPALNIEGFAWSADQTKVYILVEEMSYSTTYTATVGTVASDLYTSPLEAEFTFSFTTLTPVSIGNNLVKEVVLYPNPASEVLRIRGMEVASVKIYSITGRLVKETFNSKEVNVSDIEPGSYVITASDNTGNMVRKLIVIE
jgi:hypothetical protein